MPAEVKLSSRGNVLKITDKINKKNIPSHIHSQEGLPEVSLVNPGRKIARMKVALAQKVQTIANKPPWLLSLTVDTKLPKPFEHDCVNAKLKKFLPQVKKIFPKSYFIFVFGWSAKAGIHVHLLGRFEQKINRKKVSNLLHSIWGSLICSDKKKILKLTKPGPKAAIGYLTSCRKDNEYYRLMRLSNGGHLWGISSKDNITYCTSDEMTLSSEEWEVFKDILKQLIISNKLPESNLTQLNKTNTCLNYLPHKIQKEAFSRFVTWREEKNNA